jgi:hypothetical protein
MSERLAFVVMFSLMAAFVVGLTVLAAKSGPSPFIARGAPAGSTLAPAANDVGGGGKRSSDPHAACRSTAGHNRREPCAAGDRR